MLTIGARLIEEHREPGAVLDATNLDLMQQAYATLLSLANKVERFADQNHVGLTGKQYMAILAILHLRPDETTITNIAHKLDTSKQNAQRMLTAVQGKGYISITPGVSDKRAVNVQVTAAGAETMAENSVIGTHVLADLFHEFSEDEVGVLWRLLRKLHSFDGVAYQGFEEDVSSAFAEKHPEVARKARADLAASWNRR